MELTGEYVIPVPREEVWKALNDPEVLKACVPGCEEMEKTSDTEFTAVATLKIGAVKAKFKGSVTLSDMDPPNGYTITGQGQGGVAGFAKGGAKVHLSDAPDGAGTVLTYVADAQLGGKLAAVGSRVIQGVAKKMADDFFSRFSAALSGEGETQAGAPTKEGAAVPASSSTAPAPAAPAAPLPQATEAGPVTGRDLVFLVIGAVIGSLAVLAFSG